MFSYIVNDISHENLTREYMMRLGLSADEVESIISQCEYEKRKIIESRLVAYRAESDPLFIEWQYDLSLDKEMAWRKKVEEIKARHPKL